MQGLHHVCNNPAKFDFDQTGIYTGNKSFIFKPCCKNERGQRSCSQKVIVQSFKDLPCVYKKAHMKGFFLLFFLHCTQFHHPPPLKLSVTNSVTWVIFCWHVTPFSSLNWIRQDLAKRIQLSILCTNNHHAKFYVQNVHENPSALSFVPWPAQWQPWSIQLLTFVHARQQHSQRNCLCKTQL